MNLEDHVSLIRKLDLPWEVIFHQDPIILLLNISQNQKIKSLLKMSYQISTKFVEINFRAFNERDLKHLDW